MYLNDLKYAMRLLSKKPGFTLLTILVMATGITLSVYLFSLQNTEYFKPLPFKNGESLVVIRSIPKGSDGYGGDLNLHDLEEIRRNVKNVSEICIYTDANVNITGKDSTRRYDALFTEPNIFQISRTKPILGRGFTVDDNKLGADEVVVISHDIWKNQFSGDTQVINKTLTINSKRHRIIGVMPESYAFPARAELWLPMRENVRQVARKESGYYKAIGHIENGISMKDINIQLDVIMKRIEEKYPETNKDITAYATTVQESFTPRNAYIIFSLQRIAALLILLLASINVGNLLLSRAIERSKETAIRVSLGAPQSRVISQMLWESVIICFSGGIIGLLITAWGLEITDSLKESFNLGKTKFWLNYGLDSYSLKMFLYFVIGTILVTGLYPAWKNTTGNFNTILRDGTRGALGKKSGKLNRILVISEVFISMVILIVTTVIIIAYYEISNADHGANKEGIITAKVRLPQSSYPSSDDKTRFYTSLQHQLENSPSIGEVMISSALPGEYTRQEMIAIEGREYTAQEANSHPKANYIAVTAGSLKKLGVELKQGRYFNNIDDAADKKSIIVTDSFVSLHFQNETVIGKRIQILDQNNEWLTIIGVVKHTIQGNAVTYVHKIPSVFRPYAQDPQSEVSIAMRMQSDKSASIQSLREALKYIDPEIPAFEIDTYKEAIAKNHAPMKMISTIFVLFGIATIVLAASGVYGLTSNTIKQRTQEIGVKRALGADEQRINLEFLTVGFKQLLWGAIPGTLVGLGMGFAMSQIFKTDIHILLFVAISIFIVIGMIAMLATYLPTKQVLKIEPSEALHYE